MELENKSKLELLDILVSMNERIEELEDKLIKYRYDGLTGLKLRQDLHYEHSVIDFSDGGFRFILIDLDNLHLVNRELGYASGDSFIVRTVKKLKESFSNDDIYRIGGDEFLVRTKKPLNEIKNLSLPSTSIAIGDFKERKSISDIISELDEIIIEMKSKLKRRKGDR